MSCCLVKAKKRQVHISHLVGYYSAPDAGGPPSRRAKRKFLFLNSLKLKGKREIPAVVVNDPEAFFCLFLSFVVCFNDFYWVADLNEHWCQAGTRARENSLRLIVVRVCRIAVCLTLLIFSKAFAVVKGNACAFFLLLIYNFWYRIWWAGGVLVYWTGHASHSSPGVSPHIWVRSLFIKRVGDCLTPKQVQNDLTLSEWFISFASPILDCLT